MLAVVKANAYGHGLVATAQTLADADAFGVARLQEAQALRAAGVGHPILLMEGVTDAAGLTEAARLGLDLVVHSEQQLVLLETARDPHRFVVWLKIDTGMNRLGFRIDQVGGTLRRLGALASCVLELRLMTHFALAEEPGSTLTSRQLASFAQLTAGSGHARSMANTAAIFALPATHAEWVRPGIALYGASPFAGQTGADLGLVPAMRLVSTVIAVRDVPAGETVGYAGAWRAARDTRVAIIAAGYGDGVPRSLPSGAPVLIRGARARLVGRVSMDMMAVDVTDIDGVVAGKEAILWGPELPVEEMATYAGTNCYELLCRVSPRVPLQLV